MQVPGGLHAFLSVLVVGYLLADLLLREPLLAETLQRWALGAGGGGGGATGAGAWPRGGNGGSLLARAVSVLLGAPPAGSVYSYGLSEGLAQSLMWTALVLLLVVSGVAEAWDGMGWGSRRAEFGHAGVRLGGGAGKWQVAPRCARAPPIVDSRPAGCRWEYQACIVHVGCDGRRRCCWVKG